MYGLSQNKTRASLGSFTSTAAATSPDRPNPTWSPQFVTVEYKGRATGNYTLSAYDHDDIVLTYRIFWGISIAFDRIEDDLLTQSFQTIPETSLEQCVDYCARWTVQIPSGRGYSEICLGVTVDLAGNCFLFKGGSIEEEWIAMYKAAANGTALLITWW